jgi:hypothetical protein
VKYSYDDVGKHTSSCEEMSGKQKFWQTGKLSQYLFSPGYNPVSVGHITTKQTILWHADPFLGNDYKISYYTMTTAGQWLSSDRVVT